MKVRLYEFDADLPPDLVNDVRPGYLMRVVSKTVIKAEDDLYTVTYRLMRHVTRPPEADVSRIDWQAEE